jgi:hypothetical protein
VLARAPGARERDKSSSQEREAAAAVEEEAAAAAAAAVQGDVYDDEEEVEISWIQEKVEDVVLVTSQAMERVPGPRVGDGQLPWLVAVPLGYLGITFVIAVVRSWRKFNSSKERRKRQVTKLLCLLALMLPLYFCGGQILSDSSVSSEHCNSAVAVQGKIIPSSCKFLFVASLQSTACRIPENIL